MLDGDEAERSGITIEITRRRITDFNDLILENMFSDESAGVRATSFWAIAIMADKSEVDSLLEALGNEENPDARLSEIDSFMIFADRHNISSDSIIISQIPLEVKQSELSLIHSKIEPMLSQVEIPSYILEGGVDTDERIVQEFEVEKEQTPEIIADDHVPSTTKFETPIQQAKTKVKQILLEITPNVPISLKRISEVTGVTEKSLEIYLTELTKINPQAGNYFSLEQVFIKKIETVSQVLDPRPSVEKTCISCGAIAKRFPCETCGEGTQCATCKLNIGQGEDSLHCPYCKRPSHSKHLFEWLKIKAECPNCKEKLSADEL